MSLKKVEQVCFFASDAHLEEYKANRDLVKMRTQSLQNQRIASGDVVTLKPPLGQRGNNGEHWNLSRLDEMNLVISKAQVRAAPDRSDKTKPATLDINDIAVIQLYNNDQVPLGLPKRVRIGGWDQNDSSQDPPVWAYNTHILSPVLGKIADPDGEPFEVRQEDRTIYIGLLEIEPHISAASEDARMAS
jgi:hypothetical protein